MNDEQNNATKRHGQPPKEGRVPRDSDTEAREKIAKPLAAFLSEPRDWKALTAWGRSKRWNGGLLRHCLAWLENRGRAYTRFRDGKTFWARTDWASSTKMWAADPLPEDEP